METLYESTASLFVLIIFWMLPNEIFDVQSNIFSFCIFGLFSLMNCIFLKNGLNYDFWRLVHTSLPNYFHATITMFGRVTGCCSIHRENLSPSPSISFPQCIPPPQWPMMVGGPSELLWEGENHGNCILSLHECPCLLFTQVGLECYLVLYSVSSDYPWQWDTRPKCLCQ